MASRDALRDDRGKNGAQHSAPQAPRRVSVADADHGEAFVVAVAMVGQGPPYADLNAAVRGSE
jgi:hypothetical protein